ncbi:transposase [Streptomyces hygroscopicus subsp. hygroscopicus]|nr:transposase [Streptomyces hygroscopicus subsp. hygroscopicus]
MLRMLLDTVDYLTVQIDKLTARITNRLADLSTISGDTDDGRPGQGMLMPLTDAERLDEIPGVGPATAQVILAEIGTDMTVFPTADHLSSWARLSPRTFQSGPKNTSGPAGKGNPWLRGALGEAAVSAARTDTFLGARYRRIVKRRGHLKALVAVARSILVAAWHLLNDPTARYRDLGSDWHTKNADPARKTRDLVRPRPRRHPHPSRRLTTHRTAPQPRQHSPRGYITISAEPLSFRSARRPRRTVRRHDRRAAARRRRPHGRPGALAACPYPGRRRPGSGVHAHRRRPGRGRGRGPGRLRDPRAARPRRRLHRHAAHPGRDRAPISCSPMSAPT